MDKRLFATIVQTSAEGEAKVMSFWYPTTAVRTMVESGAANRDLGYRDTLVATESDYLIGY